MRIIKNIYLVGSGDFGLSHEFDCNVYAIVEPSGVILIDAGSGVESDTILANLAREGEDLVRQGIKCVLLTHAHADHAGGAHYFFETFGCDVMICAEEVVALETGADELIHLTLAKKSGLYSFDYKFQPCKVTRALVDNTILRFETVTITALHVPGHSVGSMCYLADFGFARALFTGDTVFPNGVLGVLNCEGSSLHDYRIYLPKLKNLGIQLLFPGHRHFVCKNGQKHIDMACEFLGRLQLPPNIL